MKKPFLLGGLVLLMLAFLVALGTWQVQRLGWKHTLIEHLQSRIGKAPVSLQTALKKFRKTGDVEYQPIFLRGRFLHDTEKHLYTLDKNGLPGWHIYTLLELGGDGCKDCPNAARFIYVNRGFVPLELKDRDKRPKGSQGAKGSQVEIVGLIRFSRNAKTLFEVENQPLKNEWFWLSLKEMSDANSGMSKEQVTHLAPFFVDQRAGVQSNQWPRPGTTRVDLTNRHLGYVITWYGLALALLGVYGFFLYGNRRQRIEGKS